MADYEKRLDELAALGVDVVAASSDTEEQARATQQETGARFPLGYGLDARAFSLATGAFWNERGNHAHATSFLVRPGGKLALAVYSTGALGRLTPQEIFIIMPFLKPKAPKG